MPTLEEVREMAIRLARDNKEGEPTITRIFWFPDAEEVHLLEVDADMTPSEEVLAFYFPPSKEVNIPLPSGIALIRPEEVRSPKVKLPEGWGTWDDAEELDLAIPQEA